MSRHEARRVFVCSRYVGDIERNVEAALALCRMAVGAGHAPFAPHLIYTRFLDERDPVQRELGISLGLRFMEVCDEVWVYTGDGISDGMRRETAHARRLGKKIVEIAEVRTCLPI